MMTRLESVFKCKAGTTATEYAVMMALIILVAVGAVMFLGNEISEVFLAITNSIS